jgi:ankyrin repeat protein
MRVVTRFLAGLAAAAALAMLTAPAQAQTFSDSYTFLKAVRERDGNKVSDLVAAPGSVVINTRDRATGDAALHYVVKGRDLNWLSFLISKGARVDIQNNEGMTALAIAARIGWAEGAQMLLDRRASVDLANSRGETPLIIAVQNRDMATVRLLLSKGADPKRRDRGAGYSALEYAKRDSRAAAILKALEASAPAKAAGPTP